MRIEVVNDLVRVMSVVVKHYDKKQLGEERIYFVYCVCVIWSPASEDTHTGHTRVLLQHSFLERKMISFWGGGPEHRKLGP